LVWFRFQGFRRKGDTALSLWSSCSFKSNEQKENFSNKRRGFFPFLSFLFPLSEIKKGKSKSEEPSPFVGKAKGERAEHKSMSKRKNKEKEKPLILECSIEGW